MDDVLDSVITDKIDANLQEYMKAIRVFSRGEIDPRSTEMESQSHIPHDVVTSMATHDLFRLGIPTEYGGLGYGVLGNCIKTMELAYVDMSTALLDIVQTSLFSKAILIGGTDVQKRRFLPNAAAGEILGCYALTEDVGSCFSKGMRTVAEFTDDHCLVTGEKQFITEAQRADLAVVFAALKGAPENPRKYIACVVPRVKAGNNGYWVERKDGKAGQHASATCSIYINAIIPRADVLGDDWEGTSGYKTSMRTLGESRPVIAAQALGGAKRAMNIALNYMASTVRGNGKYIHELDIPAHDIGVAAGQMRHMVRALIDVAQNVNNRDIGEWDVMLDSSSIKYEATDAANKICRTMMETMGGCGYTTAYKIERIFRDLAVTPVYEGPNKAIMHYAGRSLGQHAQKMVKEDRHC